MVNTGAQGGYPMNIADQVKETFVDGPGIRYAIYVSGCDRHCVNCHNPQTWDFKNGYEMTDEVIEQIVTDYKNNSLLDGFTILGGEPLHPDNRKGLAKLIAELRKVSDNIWIYTGYELEDLIKINDETLNYILYRTDILVDGPFVEGLKTDTSFIGSSNQRFIRTRDMIRDDRFSEVYVNVYLI